eukprot:COSAG06_NODE_533_length_14542_cov_17.021325_1_plen_27_part_10
MIPSHCPYYYLYLPTYPSPFSSSSSSS